MAHVARIFRALLGGQTQARLDELFAASLSGDPERDWTLTLTPRATQTAQFVRRIAPIAGGATWTKSASKKPAAASTRSVQPRPTGRRPVAEESRLPSPPMIDEHPTIEFPSAACGLQARMEAQKIASVF